MEQLAEYVDRGRTPPDPGIESSPACRRALAALERLQTVSIRLLDDDQAGPDAGAPWLDDLMRRIALDAHAGADLPVARTADGDEVVMTEGTLRALARAAGDEQPGFLVGRVRLDGGRDDPDGAVALAVDVFVAYGVVIPQGVERLRAAVQQRVQRHTRFRTVRVDVVVRDLTATADEEQRP